MVKTGIGGEVTMFEPTSLIQSDICNLIKLKQTVKYGLKGLNPFIPDELVNQSHFAFLSS